MATYGSKREIMPVYSTTRYPAEMDEAKHTIATTEIGLEKVERALNIDDIYNDETGQLVNHLQQALKAEYMFHRIPGQ